MEESGRGPPQHQHHFVLVHGVCHGAWCWYRVATLLTSAGHRVTALDMAGCGASPARGEDVASFEDYSRPLLDAVAALPPGEQAVLVGHSFGGKSLALAMERYPDRVAVAVFVSAAMPAAGKPMALVLEEFAKETGPDFYMDCTYRASSNPESPEGTLLLGPEYMAKRLYQLSPPEDLTLAKAMVRPSRCFQDDATMKGNVLTAERYGAVRRVYVVAEDDASWSAEFQRRMASWSPGTQVRSLQGADHMAMLSKSTGLSDLLVESVPMMDSARQERHHFVLVHGLCHGACCWYKVAAALESAGHRVTAPDLAASGTHPARLHEVRSFEDYSRPLLDAVNAAPDGDRLVLVGHSFGGHNLALAMERFPSKVAAAVFVSAPMPVPGRPMSMVLEQHLNGDSTPDSFMDSTFGVVELGSENPAETFLLGPEWMSQRMYQLSPAEDLTLAKTLVRPAQMFLGDEAMAGENVLTEGRYGAVSRVFVVTEEDRTWPAEEQRVVAASGGPGVEVRAIGGADHMPMFSKPAELAQLILEVADKYC